MTKGASRKNYEIQNEARFLSAAKTILDFFSPRIVTSNRDFYKNKKIEHSSASARFVVHSDSDPCDAEMIEFETPPSSTKSFHVDTVTPPSPRTMDSVTVSTPPTSFSAISPDSEKGSMFGHGPKSATENNQDLRIMLSAQSPNKTIGNVTIRHHSSQPTRKRRYEQLYLDFGQATFGARSICSTCNMLFVHGIEEDELNHRKFCDDYVNGVMFVGWKNARIHPVTLLGEKYNFHSKTSFSNISPKDTANEFIVEIRSGDPIHHRRKALQVKTIVDQELGFAPLSATVIKRKNMERIKGLRQFVPIANDNWDPVETCKREEQKHNIKLQMKKASDAYDDDCDYFFDGKTVFLYVIKKRVVGFCVVETISEAFRLLRCSSLCEISEEAPESHDGGQVLSGKQSNPTDQYILSQQSSKAWMGVYQIWCHRSFRRSGIAKRLVDTARARLFYGMTIPLDQVAFSSPTADGIKFASIYLQTASPLVYDCI